MSQSETIVFEKHNEKMLICLLSYAYLLPIIPLFFVFISFDAIFWTIKKFESPLASLRFFDHCNFICFSNSKVDIQCPKYK